MKSNGWVQLEKNDTNRSSDCLFLRQESWEFRNPYTFQVSLLPLLKHQNQMLLNMHKFVSAITYKCRCPNEINIVILQSYFGPLGSKT